MEDIKICPIGSINCPDYVACREDCAWSIGGRCAVADIAESLSAIAMDVAVMGTNNSPLI